MKKILIMMLSISIVLAACAGKGSIDGDSAASHSKALCYDPGINAFGSHFKTYLNSTGNSDLTGFGGSTSKTLDCAVTKQPIVFMHGNGDDVNGAAMGSTYGGWKASRDYFISKGYKPTELYAVNYGIPGISGASYNYHSAANLSKVKRFIDAVITYTGASKIDVIAHSLGVTMARKAIKGGTFTEYLGATINLGTNINTKVDTFVGIAGGNRGLNSCGSWPLNTWTPTCGPDGLAVNNPFLKALNGGAAYMIYGVGNTLSMKTGSYTYSIKSWVDEIVCLPSYPTYCYIYMKHTSQLDGENGSKTYSSVPYGHFGLKTQTAAVQYNMVVNHTY